MALWKGSIWKRITDDPSSKGWRNVYVVSASGAVAALAVLDEIARLEQAVHGNNITIYEEVVTSIPAHGGFDKATVNYVGAVVLGAAALPLFNTMRVDILSGFSARPERKFLRLGLGADYTLGDRWNATTVSDTAVNYSTPLAALPGYVTPTGFPHSGSFTDDFIAMRQVNWHRRFRKGFHRGYIPDA